MTSGTGGLSGMGIRYDSADAEAFQAARQVSSNGLAGWREAIARHLAPCPGMRLLDLGAGTGMWATAFAEWGAEEVLQYAGLCHACYGTDGYGEVLLSVADRAELAALIGTRAESLVYLYGSCDRRATYPRLADPGPVRFRDRFTGRVVTPVELDIRAFLELTAANELDVVQHNPAIASQHGAALLRLFTCARRRLSDAAWLSCTKLLAPYGSITGPA